jgi:hypothetical protein
MKCPGMGKDFLMVKNETSPNPKNRIWMFFASVKLTVALLLTLAVTSIIGDGDSRKMKALRHISMLTVKIFIEFFHFLIFLICIVHGGFSF